MAYYCNRSSKLPFGGEFNIFLNPKKKNNNKINIK